MIQHLRAFGDLVALGVPGDPTTAQNAVSDSTYPCQRMNLVNYELPDPALPRRARSVGLDGGSLMIRLTIREQGKLGLTLGPSINEPESMLQVKAVASNGLAAAAARAAGHEELVGLVLSEVMDQPISGIDHRAVLQQVKHGPRPIVLVFTNPPAFYTVDGIRSGKAKAITTTSPSLPATDPDGISITWGKCGHMFYTDSIKRWKLHRWKTNDAGNHLHYTCPICSRPWELDRTQRLSGVELQRIQAKMTDVVQTNWAHHRQSGKSEPLLAIAVDDAADGDAEHRWLEGKRARDKLKKIEYISESRRVHSTRRRGKPTVDDSRSPFRNAAGTADGTVGMSIAYRKKQVTGCSQAASLEADDLEYIQGEPPRIRGGTPCLIVAFSSRGPGTVISNRPDIATGKVGKGGVQVAGLQQIHDNWGPFGLQVGSFLLFLPV